MAKYVIVSSELAHARTKGSKNGLRLYQFVSGDWTDEGKRRRREEYAAKKGAAREAYINATKNINVSRTKTDADGNTRPLTEEEYKREMGIANQHYKNEEAFYQNALKELQREYGDVEDWDKFTDAKQKEFGTYMANLGKEASNAGKGISNVVDKYKSEKANSEFVRAVYAQASQMDTNTLREVTARLNAESAYLDAVKKRQAPGERKVQVSDILEGVSAAAGLAGTVFGLVKLYQEVRTK